MNTLECIKTRRSIRKFKPDPVDHATLESLIGAKHLILLPGRTLRSLDISQSKILLFLIKSLLITPPDFNAKIIKQAPMLIAVTFKKGRRGFERDGSYSTKKRRPPADVRCRCCKSDTLPCRSRSRSWNCNHGHLG